MPHDPLLTGATNRRQFLALGAGIFVVSVIPVALARRTTLARRTVPLMGTIAEIQVAHRDVRTAEDAIDAALYELDLVERTMSRFRPDSDIGRANAGAARDAIAVTPATAFVVRAALEWAQRSNGRFDPALGSVSEAWDVLNRHEPPPAERVTPLMHREGLWDRSRDRGAARARDRTRDRHRGRRSLRPRRFPRRRRLGGGDPGSA